MARADLSAMLGKLDDPTAAAPAGEPAVAEADSRPAAQLPTNRSGRGDARRLEPTPALTTTGYRSYERKEARLRPDQYARLTEESRRLNRAKKPGGERITENTLIRIAIDLLLERTDQLAGASEVELRKSVGL